MKSVFIVQHPKGTSREVGMTEALAADKAIADLGLKVVGGSYAQDGSANAAAVDMVMRPEPVLIARCPEHGLHGERQECFECGGPVEQVPMVPVNLGGGE